MFPLFMQAFSAWEKPPLIVLGNKADLEGSRKVSSFVGEAEAQAHGARFAEVSAKTGAGVDDVSTWVLGSTHLGVREHSIMSSLMSTFM